MSKAFKVINNKQDARNMAIAWQNWQAKHNLSYDELFKYNSFFTSIGKKFNLLTEFKENGII